MSAATFKGSTINWPLLRIFLETLLELIFFFFDPFWEFLHMWRMKPLKEPECQGTGKKDPERTVIVFPPIQRAHLNDLHLVFFPSMAGRSWTRTTRPLSTRRSSLPLRCPRAGKRRWTISVVPITSTTTTGPLSGTDRA